MHAYVEEFGASIVPAYRRGVADAEWPADVGLARSIIPPGTAATRDFSRLAPRIPQLIAERCVGCMACVNACPDTAILGIAVPESDARRRAIDAFAGDEPNPTLAAATAQAHFVRHAEVRRGARQARPRAGALRDLRRPGPLQGLRRVRRGVRGPRPRRAGDDRQGRPRMPSGETDARPGRRATCASSARCRRRRPSTATRRRSPT